MARVEAPGYTCPMNCTCCAAQKNFRQICVRSILFQHCWMDLNLKFQRPMLNLSRRRRQSRSLSNVILDQWNIFRSCNACLLYASMRSISVCTCRCTDCVKSCNLGNLLPTATRLNFQIFFDKKNTKVCGFFLKLFHRCCATPS